MPWAGRVGADVRARWAALLVALVAAAGLAGGTAFALDRTFQPGATAPPQLKGVPPSALAQMGVTLSAASAPVYCRALSLAGEHGFTPTDQTGCPISRAEAEAAFRRVFPGVPPGLGVSSVAPATAPQATVQDAALVRASVPSQPLIGKDHLVWLLVVQTAYPYYRLRPFIACPVPVATIARPSASPCRRLGGTLTQLVFVDTAQARFLVALPLGLPPSAASIVGPPLVTGPVGRGSGA